MMKYRQEIITVNRKGASMNGVADWLSSWAGDLWGYVLILIAVCAVFAPIVYYFTRRTMAKRKWKAGLRYIVISGPGNWQRAARFAGLAIP